MKVALVAPAPDPPTLGGAQRAWAGLHRALLDAGHQADPVTQPVRETTLAELVAGYRTFAALDLSPFDVVISSKYPAWMVAHPHHVVWMFHPLRGLYDTYHLFGMPLDPGPVQPATAALLAAVARPPHRRALAEVLGRAEEAVTALGSEHPDLSLPGPVSRRVVRWLDQVALDPVAITRHVALSRTVATRADYFPAGVAVRVAHAPSDLVTPAPGQAGGGRHLFTASRLDGPKRLDLLVRAMDHVPGDLPLLIGGTGPEGARLRVLARADERIRFLGHVDDEELADLYAGARAVPFVPRDEDYGLITVEAMAAGAPVVTCSDSGGPAELVRHGRHGLVVDPDPASVGRALATLVADPRRAAALGRAARRRAEAVTWPAVVRTLLGPDAATKPASPATAVSAGAGVTRPIMPSAIRGRRPRVVVLTTFRVAERGHGGQLRGFHLYGALARHAEVEIVSLASGGPAGSTELAPGLVETAVPISDAHRAASDEMTLAVGVPISDLAAGSEIARTPEYLTTLGRAARHADAVILAEPYLLPALAAAEVELPFIYDAFNVEADLKAEILPRTPAGDAALARVEAIERAATAGAAVITACSAADARSLATDAGRPAGDAVVVPNGTDCSAVTPPTPQQRRRDGRRWLDRHRGLDGRDRPAVALAVFFGSWHPPNLAAAEVVLDLAERLTGMVFVLGGRHGDALAGRPLPANVIVTGVVTGRTKDLLLRVADVALNPMMSGSGTNLKVIEYLAAGVPVVSTPFGARGLDLVDEEHLLLAPVGRLADAVWQVVDDPDSAADRAAAGRARVEERYDWPRLGDRLAEVVAQVTGPG